MGRYINRTSKGPLGTSAGEKSRGLLEDGAREISKPTKFEPNMVCVVNNGMFAAAGYMYKESEMQEFANPSDSRPKKWFIWDKVEQYAD
jgi:hypothetical protein